MSAFELIDIMFLRNLLKTKHELWQHDQDDLHDCLYYWDFSAGIASILCLKSVTGQEVLSFTNKLPDTFQMKQLRLSFLCSKRN